MQFTTASHGGSALDDDDDAGALFLAPKFAKSGVSTFATAAGRNESSLLPTGEVPDARPVGYYRVNPSFESDDAPPVIFRTLLDALTKHGVKGTPRADWSVRVRPGVDDGSALVDDPTCLPVLSLSWLSLSRSGRRSFGTLTRLREWRWE